MRALAIAVVMCAAASADAAPWSFELPAGYTEVPGAAESQLQVLRKQPTTVSVDAQVYLAPDQTVQLTRITLLSKMSTLPSRASLVQMDRGVVSGASKQATKHVSDTRNWVGDQLVADTVDEKDEIRVHQRRLYSADAEGVVHMFTLICAGAADQLAECEKAQQTMQLTLPNQAALPNESPKRKHDIAYVIGQIMGGLVVVVLLIWLLVRRRKS
jgi:hypothetical protein